MKLRVDNREKEEVIAELCLLQEELQAKGEEFEIEKEQLICGDVVCGNVCIERKEAGDFVGSIIDRRLKEQAAKMSLNFEHNYIILVGDVWATSSSIHGRAIVGMQCALAVRHNMKFIHVRNNEEFAWACWSIISKIQDGELFNPAEHTIHKYDVSASDRFVACITASGVGIERAKAIGAKCEYDIRLLLANIDELDELEGVGKTSIKKLKEMLGVDL
jgi:DNA excision repair protein ERCC-4